MMRLLGGLLVLVIAAVGGAFWFAGRGIPPAITIAQPAQVVGQTGTLEVTVEAPFERLTVLTISVRQGERTIPLFSLDDRHSAVLTNAAERVSVSRPLGKQSVPELQQGEATIIVAAATRSFLGLRTLSSDASRGVRVRLEPPRIAVLSTHHYVNHGGSEMVVYDASPSDVRSGVRVGDVEYVGFPASGAGISNATPSTMVAFFALLYDQDLHAPIVAFARDDANNEAHVTFVDNVFEKPVRHSRIAIDDAYINRVVPEIISHSPELKMDVPTGEMLPAFLKVNGELRRLNADAIGALAKQTAPTRLWEGPFVQLGNSKVEAGFADQRTYVYKGKDVDQQVHLGFDLAVTAHVPVLAANAGIIVQASWLGIYGNCIVIDHGLGVQSLYAHLMSFDVKVGDRITRGQQIGRSDSTGLAGGDHLHFTMLVGGHMVNPVEWWDPHWIADRVDRKLRDTTH